MYIKVANLQVCVFYNQKLHCM